MAARAQSQSPAGASSSGRVTVDAWLSFIKIRANAQWKTNGRGESVDFTGVRRPRIGTKYRSLPGRLRDLQLIPQKMANRRDLGGHEIRIGWGVVRGWLVAYADVFFERLLDDSIFMMFVIQKTSREIAEADVECGQGLRGAVM